MLPTTGEPKIIHNDQIVGNTCDPETLDHFHDTRQPILQHYMDIHDIMATSTRVHNTNDMHNSFASLTESC
jgi:hypothetical protein